MSAETGAGAWLWASGSQACNGASPTLVPNPITSSVTAIRVTPGSRLVPAAASRAQSRSAGLGVWAEA